MRSIHARNVLAAGLASVTLWFGWVGAAAAATGEEVYRQQCLPCHGDKGAGDGPLAKTLATPPKAFSGLVTRVSAERAVMVGVGDAPGHAVGRLLTPAEVEGLVNYVEAMGK